MLPVLAVDQQPVLPVDPASPVNQQPVDLVLPGNPVLPVDRCNLSAGAVCQASGCMAASFVPLHSKH